MAKRKPINKEKNYCDWCGKTTYMEAMIVASTPILEFIEDKIDEYGREEIWGEFSDWSGEDIDSDFEAELLVYDEMLNKLSKQVVCIDCLKQDEELYMKYYGDEDWEIDEIDDSDDEDEDDEDENAIRFNAKF